MHQEGVPLSGDGGPVPRLAPTLSTLRSSGKHGIPFRKFGGIKFAESAHIKDALSFLRVVVNPSDTILAVCMLKLVDHIGDATVQQILDYLGIESKEFRTARERGAVQEAETVPVEGGLQGPVGEAAHVLQTVAEQKTVRTQLSAIERFYRPILQATYDDHPRRRREMDHLISIAKRYASAEELLADVALDPVDMALAEAQARGQGFVTSRRSIRRRGSNGTRSL